MLCKTNTGHAGQLQGTQDKYRALRTNAGHAGQMQDTQDKCRASRTNTGHAGQIQGTQHRFFIIFILSIAIAVSYATTLHDPKKYGARGQLVQGVDCKERGPHAQNTSCIETAWVEKMTLTKVQDNAQIVPSSG